MFGLTSRFPVSDEERQWTDAAFTQLSTILGRDRMLTAQVVLPDDRFFPDAYRGTQESATAMGKRLAGYMAIPSDSFTVKIYAEGEDAWREGLPSWEEQRSYAAGVYLHKPQEGRFVIGVHANQLKDPISLAATLGHELAHVLLLGGRLLAPEHPDMEPLTEIATIFFGLGVIRANGVSSFKQWNEGGSHGWRFQRSGYLPETVWAYGLARFAAEGHEIRPSWAGSLRGNVRPYIRNAEKYLQRNPLAAAS